MQPLYYLIHLILIIFVCNLLYYSTFYIKIKHFKLTANADKLGVLYFKKKKGEKQMSKFSMELQPYDDLFSTEEDRQDAKREKIMNISLEELHPFKDHPFQVIDNDELQELVKSIAVNGVVTPAIARPRAEGGYELISGHRRRAACQLAGINTLPVIIRNLDDDAATIIMVDSNQQRENILPSEKAYSYKMKPEAIKRQAGRPNKNNSARVGLNFDGKQSRDILAEQMGESKNQIQRYIRLTELINPILKMVDEKQIAFNPAVELSYLPKKTQETLVEAMSLQQCTPSLSQAVRLKILHQQGSLKVEDVFKILTEEKANRAKRS